MKTLRIIPLFALVVRPVLAQDVDAMARWTSLTVVQIAHVRLQCGDATVQTADATSQMPDVTGPVRRPTRAPDASQPFGGG